MKNVATIDADTDGIMSDPVMRREYEFDRMVVSLLNAINDLHELIADPAGRALIRSEMESLVSARLLFGKVLNAAWTK